MPLNFGGQKRSGAFDTVWPSAKVDVDKVFRPLAPPHRRPAHVERTAREKENHGNGRTSPQASQDERGHSRTSPGLCLWMPHAPAEGRKRKERTTGERKNADSTLRCSQAVPHPSTNQALGSLTSEVRRDPVYSTRYGRQRIQLNSTQLHKQMCSL